MTVLHDLQKKGQTLKKQTTRKLASHKKAGSQNDISLRSIR